MMRGKIRMKRLGATLLVVALVFAILLLPDSSVAPGTSRCGCDKAQSSEPYSTIRAIVDSPAKAVIHGTWNYKAYVNGKLVEDPFVIGTYGSGSSFHLGTFLILKWPAGSWQYNVFNMNGNDVTGWACGLTPVVNTQYNIPNNVTTFMTALSSCSGNAIGWLARYRPCCHDYKRYAVYVPVTVQSGKSYRVTFVDYGVNFQNTTNLDPSSYLFLIRPFGYSGNPTFQLLDTSGSPISSVSEQETFQRVSGNLAKVTFSIIYSGSSSVQVKEIRVTLNNYAYGRIIFKNPVTLAPGDSIDIRVDVTLT